MGGMGRAQPMGRAMQVTPMMNQPPPGLAGPGRGVGMGGPGMPPPMRGPPAMPPPMHGGPPPPGMGRPPVGMM